MCEPQAIITKIELIRSTLHTSDCTTKSMKVNAEQVSNKECFKTSYKPKQKHHLSVEKHNA